MRSKVLILFCCCVLCVACNGSSSEPPPGPIIIVEPIAPEPTALVWKVNATQQTAGPSILDPLDTANYCKLRDDFIGTSKKEFRFYPDTGGSTEPAKHVVFEATNLKLEIQHYPSLNILIWKITDKSQSPAFHCTLAPSGQTNTGTVPAEFVGFMDSELKETDPTATDGDKLKIQVMMPN